MPVTFQGGENALTSAGRGAGSIALLQGSLQWVRRRDHPFRTRSVPKTALGKDKTFQFMFTMTLSPAVKIMSLGLFFCLKPFPDLSFFRTGAC